MNGKKCIFYKKQPVYSSKCRNTQLIEKYIHKETPTGSKVAQYTYYDIKIEKVELLLNEKI